MSTKPTPHGTPSGYSYHKCRCATCVEGNRIRGRAYAKRYKERHPERVLYSQRAYRERNITEIRERDRLKSREKYAQNPDKEREIARRSQRNNRERNNARKLGYYYSNHELSRDRQNARNRIGLEISGNRKRQPWTSEENAIAVNPDLTQVEKAYMLRRSLSSIASQAHRLRTAQVTA